MPGKEIDDRLKTLFGDLEGHIEPSNGKNGTAHVVQNEESGMNGTAVPAAPRPADRICPFLNTTWDATIRYSYPSPENACYRLKKSRPVSLTDQEAFCLGKQHRHCPIYKSAKGPERDGLLHPFVHFLKHSLFRKNHHNRS